MLLLNARSACYECMAFLNIRITVVKKVSFAIIVDLPIATYNHTSIIKVIIYHHYYIHVYKSCHITRALSSLSTHLWSCSHVLDAPCVEKYSL